MEAKIYNPAFFSINKLRQRGSNAVSTLKQNRSLILKLIKDEGVITRKDLAERTGLKLATITTVINKLLDAGIIEEAGVVQGDSGRRVMGFKFISGKYCTIAIRLNISYIKVGLYDINTNNLSIKKIFFDTLQNIDETCNRITKEIEELKPIIGNMQVLGIGVAVEGPFVLKGEHYMLPFPQHKDGYYDLGKVLHERTNYPVIIHRENNFSVYKVWKTEHEKKALGIIINIFVSYAIECGIMFNGEIVIGQQGASGLLGKTAARFDEHGIITLDDEISSISILKRVLYLIPKYPDSILVSKKDDLNIRDVIKAFHFGDDLATLVFTDAGIILGRSVAQLINLLNPNLIVIGDEIPICDKFLAIVEGEVKRYISKEVSPNITLYPSNPAYARETKFDQCLVGASYYITDLFIESLDLGEE